MPLDLTELGSLANADFGVAATFSPAIGAAFGINGVFDEGFRDLTILDDAVPTTTEIPVLGVNLSDFRSPPLQGDRLTIKAGAYAGRGYIVREVRLDSHGWAILMLNFVG